jgi:hypothetical protein
MIEIRDGRIYFYHIHKTEVQAKDFQCISAYVCPVCKNVLLAYFVGYIKDLTDYADKENMKYAYDMGNCNGGQWIALEHSKHKECCKWEYSTARGISNGVEAFLKQYKAMVDKQALIDAIEKGLEGYKFVPDVIGVDAPLLMYNENEIVDAKEGLTFDEKWKRIEKMGEYLKEKISNSCPPLQSFFLE